MRYVLISRNSQVVRKNVYTGDNSKIDILIQADISVGETFQEVDQKSFDLAVVVATTTKDQTDWQTAKGVGISMALSFIGKKLGFE